MPATFPVSSGENLTLIAQLFPGLKLAGQLLLEIRKSSEAITAPTNIAKEFSFVSVMVTGALDVPTF